MSSTAKMTRIMMTLAFFALMTFASAAFADVIQLSGNNLGIAGSIGTITLTQNGTNDVHVVITANDPYSIKTANGSDIGFNAVASVSGAGIFGDGTAATSFSYGSGNVDGGGTFATTLDHILFADNRQFVTSYSFDLVASGLTVSSLEAMNANGNSWIVHFCSSTATSGALSCAAGTGYAYGSTPTPNVPEPASMLLLGTGMFSLGGFRRRRMNK
jgi:hypothetical protein